MGIGQKKNCFRIILQYRSLGRVEQPEAGAQDTLLKFRIIGLAERSAQFVGDPKRPRRFDFFGVQTHQTDLGRREPLFFDVMRHSADGGRAFRSYRHEQNGIDALAPHQPGNLARAVLVLPRINRTRYGVMEIRDRADEAFRRQLF